MKAVKFAGFVSSHVYGGEMMQRTCVTVRDKLTGEIVARGTQTEVAEQLHVTLCMSCGCCSFVCPANRPMAQTNQLAKQALLAQQKTKKEA